MRVILRYCLATGRRRSAFALCGFVPTHSVYFRLIATACLLFGVLASSCAGAAGKEIVLSDEALPAPPPESRKVSKEEAPQPSENKASHAEEVEPAEPVERPPLATDDPLDALYRQAITLDGRGRPLVSVRLMSGQATVRVRARTGGLIVRPRPFSEEPKMLVRSPRGETLRLEMTAHSAGQTRSFPIVADLVAGSSSEDAVREVVREWGMRERDVRLETVGSLFGLGGRVIDNRRVLVLLDGPGDARWAAAAAEEVARYMNQTPVLHQVRLARPSAVISVYDESGTLMAKGDGHLSLEADDGGIIEVLAVEHGVGYSWHGREDRAYEGEIHLAADDRALSVVNLIPLETLLLGIVPAETFASAHVEALKAQAVTARTDILAKIGTRHFADPALVCAETHCQVYKGSDASVESTDAAIRMTAGEVLFGEDGRLVHAVYSAMCGGHTENNEVVWGTPPNPALRGRLDFPAEGEWLTFAAGISESDLDTWLSKEPPAWCRLASMGSASRYRWERRISLPEIDRLVSHMNVGSIRSIQVLGRGVSGRVTGVRIEGTKGSAVVRRELPIRRLFGNLNSGMFIVRTERGDDGLPVAFVFQGGGWGHGVGMCQTGAIGMAEHGHSYRSILRHYYNEVTIDSLY